MLEGLRKDATIVCQKPALSEPCLPTQEVELKLFPFYIIYKMGTTSWTDYRRYLNQNALYKNEMLLQNERFSRYLKYRGLNKY